MNTKPKFIALIFLSNVALYIGERCAVHLYNHPDISLIILITFMVSTFLSFLLGILYASISR